ncbi:unnamed protein product [[Candida] boidinii]|nr:unnamed protein product [[Candida] boidinii]
MSATDFLMKAANSKRSLPVEEATTEEFDRSSTKNDRIERIPWVEKYRPKNLDEDTSQSNTIKILKKNLQTSNLPHMLFYGPPGTGKTSTILAMAKELYGPELFKSRVLELNASDERGISIVREKIKNFARLSVSHPSEEDKSKYPCPPYKLIILDEADSMTSDAQSALRRTMENYSGITRFCLICNYITRIIDPLASRCSKFRFKSLNSTDSLDRLKFIIKNENLNLKNQDEICLEILKVSNGDLRKAITFFQSACKLFSAKLLTSTNKNNSDDIEMLDGIDKEEVVNPNTNNNEIEMTIDEIRELAGLIPYNLTNNLINLISSNNFNNIFEFLNNEIFRKGYNATTVLDTLHDKLLLDSNSDNEDDSKDLNLSLSLNNEQKNKISKILFDTDCKLSNGGNEPIQILNLAIHISNILN